MRGSGRTKSKSADEHDVLGNELGVRGSRRDRNDAKEDELKQMYLGQNLEYGSSGLDDEPMPQVNNQNMPPVNNQATP